MGKMWLLEFNLDKCKVLHIELNNNQHLDYTFLVSNYYIFTNNLFDIYIYLLCDFKTTYLMIFIQTFTTTYALYKIR